MKKKRKKKTKNLYFTKEHENAIIKYNETSCPKERNTLYKELIKPAFSELVDTIVYTYKFSTLPNVGELKEECKTWLLTIISKFDPSKNSKAFSYFSVVTKNWFIHEVKENSLSLKREVAYDDIIKSKSLSTGNNLSQTRSSFAVGQLQFDLVYEHAYEVDRETNEFWIGLWKEMAEWEKLDLKDNEKRTLEAVKILFRSVDDIEIFNKKAIYLYLREITGFNTKQIVNSLGRIREKYRKFKKDWDEGEI